MDGTRRSGVARSQRLNGTSTEASTSVLGALARLSGVPGRVAGAGMRLVRWQSTSWEKCVAECSGLH